METTKPKPFVFVLMPFDRQFDDVYKLGIKAACTDAGGYCERVDEQIFEESILDRVYNQIAKADLIVADMTGRNPNVFYEVGYAHALGQRVILLTQNADDIPFDLKHFSHIVYGGRIADLKPELEKRVRWAFEHRRENLDSLTNLSFFVNDVPISAAPTIKLQPTSEYRTIELDVSAHNSIERVIMQVNFKAGLITPAMFQYADVSLTDQGKVSSFKQQNNSILHLVSVDFRLLPGTWTKFRVSFRRERLLSFPTNEEFKLTLRTFSEAGTQDFPFSVQFKAESVEIVEVPSLPKRNPNAGW